MSAPATKFEGVAAEWRAARRVYPVYLAVVKRFDVGMEPCRELESPIDRADAETLKAMRDWLEQMDERCSAMHLRQVLQALPIGNEQNLRALLQRYLGVTDGLERFRDKVDFLLVQYFSQVAPAEMSSGTVKLEDVAQVLEPVIGEASLRMPAFMGGLEMLLVRLGQCGSLAELMKEGILEQGREMKQQAGPMYFGSGVMLAFTRYNLMVRHAFMRVLQSDLAHVGVVLNQLESRGVEVVDCSASEFGGPRTIAELRSLCRDWRSPFHAEYKSGHSFQLLMDIRKAADSALAMAPQIAKTPIKITIEEEDLNPDDRVEMDSGPEELVTSVVAEPQSPAVQAVSPAQPVTMNVQSTLELIAEQLFAGELLKQHLPVSSVKIGESRVLLSSWEVAAFLKGGDDISDALQRAVSMRALLFECLDRCRNGRLAGELGLILSMSHAQAAELQELIAQARDKRNIDTAVNLAATAKRLLTLMDEAEHLLAQGSAAKGAN